MFKLGAGVIVFRLNENALLVDSRTGRYMALNCTAMEMLEAVQTNEDEELIIAQLAKRFATDEHTLMAGLQVLQQRLSELELLN